MPNKVKYKYDKVTLQRIVIESLSIREVMTKLGIAPISGGMHAHIKARIVKDGIDISHFKGKGSNFGNRHTGGSARLTPQQILVINEDGYKTKAELLRRALLEIGRQYICYICDLGGVWQEIPLKLEVEHKNGDTLDNREENLEFICPNCHSQTETYCKVKSILHGQKSISPK